MKKAKEVCHVHVGILTPDCFCFEPIQNWLSVRSRGRALLVESLPIQMAYSVNFVDIGGSLVALGLFSMLTSFRSFMQ